RSKSADGDRVSLITLDQFVEQRKIGRIDCIKIDAEGSDFEVVKGARHTIEQRKPAIILETDHLGRFGSSKAEVARFLEVLDYSVSEIKLEHTTDFVCLPKR